MHFTTAKDTRDKLIDPINKNKVINTTFTITNKYLNLCDYNRGVVKLALINRLGLNSEIDIDKQYIIVYTPQGKRYAAKLEPMALSLERLTRRPDAFLNQSYHFHMALPKTILPIYAEQGRCTFSPYIHEVIFRLNPPNYSSGRIEQEFTTLSALPIPIRTRDGLEFWSVENYYQASKTKNYDIRSYISNTFPKAARNYWRNRESAIRNDWHKYRREAMFAGLLHMFKVDALARKKLLDTKGYPIVQFNNWADRYWGVSVSDFTGRNMMGRMLMNIRHKLMHEDIPF